MRPSGFVFLSLEHLIQTVVLDSGSSGDGLLSVYRCSAPSRLWSGPGRVVDTTLFALLI